ncbi:hypothetical protein GJ496_011304 [Pomphorhynchus laevis]|nr:hypothetical protein GJ496_011304 [Pomphorhynchus laevis]
MQLTDFQKIGFGLLLCGLSFLFLGVILFFDKGLLALGNLLFLVGLFLLAGIERTLRLCFQRNKIVSTGFTFVGITLILLGWAIIGLLFEIYGLLNLFGGLLPTIIVFLRQLPIIGHMLVLPGISQVIDQMFGSRSMMKVLYALFLYHLQQISLAEIPAKPLNNENDYDMCESISYRLAAPFSVKNGNEINAWRLIDSIITTNEMIVLLNREAYGGAIWNLQPLNSSKWNIHFTVNISSDISDGSTIAFWYIKEPLIVGPIYGYKNYFRGVGIIISIDKTRSDTASSINLDVISNNGSKCYSKYKHASKKSRCSLDFNSQDDFYKLDVYIYFNNSFLTVSLTSPHSNSITSCCSNLSIGISNGYIGFTTAKFEKNNGILALTEFTILSSPSMSPIDESFNRAIPILLLTICIYGLYKATQTVNVSKMKIE